ncbi:MAG TPA: hypothetical protein VGG69_11605 [Rhizomicrobium sp.]
MDALDDRQVRPADSTNLVDEISRYCRNHGMAESTFGRLSVNDGKLVSRLRTGGRLTSETHARVHAFMASDGAPLRRQPRAFGREFSTATGTHAVSGLPAVSGDAEKNFRFYDNRQKYLLFVTTCSEKWVIADRVAQELQHIHPRPPAVRLFDAGAGDGTVLARVMRAMHHRFANLPFYAVGKEISLEDVRLTLEKMPDRFCEHPATVLVMTNMYYAEAPWLTPKTVTAASSMVWREVALSGSTGHDFERQITELQPFLSEHWRARVSPKSGNPVYEKPVVLVLYRNDYKFLLNSVLPRPGFARADFDLVIASQPYRARAPVEFKARRVIAPLARALGPGGRLIGVHSHGDDPGLEIVRRIWPNENPFTADRHAILRAVKAELGKDARLMNFKASSDAHALFRYDMHTLPHEISESSIGTSTLLAAWNAAVYVAQIEDHRLASVMSNQAYLEATRDVLRKHSGLWFCDESYVISRRPELS